MDVHAENSGSSTGAAVPATGTTAALAQPNELLLLALGTRAGSAFSTVAGFTARTSASYNSGTSSTSRTVQLFDKKLTTDQTGQSAVVANAGNSIGWAASLAAMK